MKDNLSYDEDNNFDMNDQIENYSEDENKQENDNNNDEEDDNNNENMTQNQKGKDSLENQNKQTKQKRRSKNDFYGRDYLCGCGKTYLSYPALYTHIRTKHNGKTPEGTNANQVQSGKGRGRPRKNFLLIEDNINRIRRENNRKMNEGNNNELKDMLNHNSFNMENFKKVEWRFLLVYKNLGLIKNGVVIDVDNDVNNENINENESENKGNDTNNINNNISQEDLEENDVYEEKKLNIEYDEIYSDNDSINNNNNNNINNNNILNVIDNKSLNKINNNNNNNKNSSTKKNIQNSNEKKFNNESEINNNINIINNNIDNNNNNENENENYSILNILEKYISSDNSNSNSYIPIYNHIKNFVSLKKFHLSQDDDKSLITCDQSFALFLIYISEKINSNFFEIVVIIIKLYRDCMNKLGWEILSKYKTLDDEEISFKYSFCEKKDPMKLPEISNDFIKFYLPKILPNFDIYLVMVIIGHFNYWLYWNDLSFINLNLFGEEKIFNNNNNINKNKNNNNNNENNNNNGKNNKYSFDGNLVIDGSNYNNEKFKDKINSLIKQ